MTRILLDLQTLQSQSRRRGIGSYTRGLADALLRRDDAEWHVLLTDAMPDTLAEARRWAETRLPQARIHVFSGLRPVAGIDPANRARARVAEALYAGFLDALDVDLVHAASPFDGWGDETTLDWTPLPNHAARTATLFDLIPFEEPALFLPEPGVRDWYERRLAGVAEADGLLAISEHTRNAALARLALVPSRVTAIGADVDPVFRPHELTADEAAAILARHGITKPFVLHVGILEPRKNVEALIDAFALLPPELRDRHQIVLATKFTEDHAARMRDRLKAAGLPRSTVVMPGFVDDEDLSRLYSLATAAVMPSRREGFGLPLLEAMRCGCPVLGSAATSLPEVIGRADLTFDPARPASIAERLAPMLGDPAFRAEAKAHGARQQARFSWDRSAAVASEAFREIVARRAAARREPAPAPVTVPSAPGLYRLALDGAEAFEPVALSEGAEGPGLLLSTGPDVALPRDSTVVGLLTPTSPAARPDGVLAQDSPSEVQGWSLALDGHARTGPMPAPAVFVTLPEAVAYARGAHPLARAGQTVDRVAELGVPVAERVTVAEALAENHAPRRAERRLLVDVTELARRDVKTGIQRVVRNVASCLIAASGSYAVELVAREDATYRYARAFADRLAPGRAPEGPDAPVDFRPEDTFLGLDLDASLTPSAAEVLHHQHQRGVTMVHVVYDVLPIRRPDWFGQGMSDLFTAWTSVLGRVSDGLASISQATADDVRGVIEEGGLAADRAIEYGVFHLGAELDGAEHAPSREPLPFEGRRPVFVTVGTVEPRKGHVDLLDAAERLWERGRDVTFVVVGKAGWLVGPLIDRLRDHPEQGKRLHWLESPSDAVLQRVYANATAALLPSEGEGFGLPLVEAARVGLPILARDLPVFREIGGAHATYFGGGGRRLAEAIERWIEAHDAGRAPPSAGIEPLSWPRSTQVLLDFVQRVTHRA